MERLVVLREELHGLWVACFCTVGVTNAVRAGEPAFFSGSGRCCPTGTINIILLTNARLSVPAMVGAVQVTTEAKTAVLLDRRIRSRSGLPGATGTGTDTVVVAAPLQGTRKVHYSGTHTEIGSLVGQVVSQAVRQGLTHVQDWDKTVRRRMSRPKGT
jgi:adenosylcobinamide amidohydrolase